MLDPPVMRIQIRQAVRGGSSSADSKKKKAEESELVLDLRLGNHDVAKKTIYARLEGDSVILALPDKLMEVLPKNPLAFRDRTVIHEAPGQIERLTIQRGDRVVEVEPETQGSPNAWRMLRPVEAPADVPTVTQVVTLLSHLRRRTSSPRRSPRRRRPGWIGPCWRSVGNPTPSTG